MSWEKLYLAMLGIQPRTDLLLDKVHALLLLSCGCGHDKDPHVQVATFLTHSFFVLGLLLSCPANEFDWLHNL